MGLKRSTSKRLAAAFERGIRQTVKFQGVQKGTRVQRQGKMRDAVSTAYQRFAKEKLQQARLARIKRLASEAKSANANFVEFSQRTNKTDFIKNLELHRKALAYKRKRKAYLETVLRFARQGFVIAPTEKVQQELDVVNQDIARMSEQIRLTKPKATEQRKKFRRLKRGERLLELLETNRKAIQEWHEKGESKSAPEYLSLLKEAKMLVEKTRKHNEEKK